MHFRIGLFIPANPWQDVTKVVIPVQENGHIDSDALRRLLKCRMLEALYPASNDYLEDYVDGSSDWVMFGDEEGRLVMDPEENVRATMLFDYPYLLVGDVVVFGDVNTDSERTTCSIPMEMLDLLKTGNK